MKRAVVALMLAALAAPVFAQAAARAENEPDLMLMLLRYVDRFNKGDAAGLANGDVYVRADQAALDAKFKELRADSFGRLEVYSTDFCAAGPDKGKALMKYARLYTFGGKMNDDEAKVFDLVKTPEGWRISGEADTPFDTTLSC